jgi:hypothetical protein
MRQYLEISTLHFETEFFGKIKVHNFTLFEPLGKMLPQEE